MPTPDELQILAQIASSEIGPDNGLEFYEDILLSLEQQELVRLDRRKTKIVSAIVTSKGAKALED